MPAPDKRLDAEEPDFSSGTGSDKEGKKDEPIDLLNPIMTPRSHHINLILKRKRDQDRTQKGTPSDIEGII